MPKIRKVKRRKKFRVNVNRKRLRNKMKKLPSIPCDVIKEAWEVSKSTRTNLRQMGLAYDANEAVKIPNTKKEILDEAKHKLKSDSMEEIDKNEEEVPPKAYVAAVLEADANAPRERMFRLPNAQVRFLTYLLDKYGEDYKAMVKDKKNHYQLTWRQIRAKINTFKSIPEQYNQYLEQKMET